MKVYVYWNLQVGGYSIQAAEGPARGLIIGYASEVLVADVVPHINHTARLKCINSKKRVHAGLKGRLVAFRGTYTPTGEVNVPERARYVSLEALQTLEQSAGAGAPITYNPKRDESFVYRADLRPYAGSALVYGRTRDDGRADCHAI